MSKIAHPANTPRSESSRPSQVPHQAPSFEKVWDAITKRGQCVEDRFFSARSAPLGKNKFAHIGIVDGMGPEAGRHFVGQLLNEGFSRLDKNEKTDQNAPQFTLSSRSAEIGDRTKYLLQHRVADLPPEAREQVLAAPDPANPLTGMLRSIRDLEHAEAKLFAVTCNTAHAWAAQLRSNTRMRFVHIVDAALNEAVEQPAIKAKIDSGQTVKIGLMATTGTVRNRIYRDRLQALAGEDAKFKNVEIVIPDADVQENLVMKGIYDPRLGVKGNNLEQAKVLLKQAANHLIEEKGAEALSLSCTEIPLVLSQADFDGKGIPVIDANAALARETIKVSMEIRNEELKAAARDTQGHPPPVPKAKL